MNDRFGTARDAVRAWLGAPGIEHTQECDGPDYVLWLYRMPAKGLYGTLELIDVPDLSDGGAVLALTLGLDLPGLRSVGDAYALLEINEVLTGCAVFARESDGEAPFSLIAKMPVGEVTGSAAAETLFRRLERAKHFIEDDN